MNPRSLRHRLEKAAKLLVTVQKHCPEAHCVIDEDKGENGHLVVESANTGDNLSKIRALGQDLEGKGYRFIEKRNPWLGQITYTGRSEGKPTAVLSLPIHKDRLAIHKDSPVHEYSFKQTQQ